MLALITGASSGIGYALAVESAKRGYDLIVASSGDRLAPAAEHFTSFGLRSFGRRVTEANVDLATPTGVDALWRQVETESEPVEVACINR